MASHPLAGRALAAAFLLAAAAPASDWPRFRGPNGTGVSADQDVPVRWNATEGVLWKVHLPGAGNGSPIVQAGKLYLQAASADARDRLLLCLDAATGKEVWTTRIP